MPQPLHDKLICATLVAVTRPRRKYWQKKGKLIMQRRTFLHTLLAGAGGVALGGRLAHAALPKMKITRVRYYSPGKETRGGVPNLTSSAKRHLYRHRCGHYWNRRRRDEGHTGTLCLSAHRPRPGQDRHSLARHVSRAFYPSGLEKLHALGGLDIALWDIKGKALGVPVYALLGGPTRDLCECYGGGGQGKTSIKEAARASMEAGFKAFRTEVIGPGLSDTGTNSRGAKNWNPHQAVLATFKRLPGNS